jgi:hypothetical protein
VKDPRAILDLPAGFSYSIISRMGEEMSDGLLVPGLPDAMAAFPAEDGLTAIVRNHELEAAWRASPGISPFGVANERLKLIDSDKLYDPGAPSIGGTTTLLFDTQGGRLRKQFLSLGGTNRNCAGGTTPWGSWLSCEEDDVNEGDREATKRHGYVFEVPSSARTLVHAAPIKPMGRFMHEALCIDPRTGIVYMTEDRPDGLLYRYIPDEPGRLHAGGRLQALALREWNSADTSNHDHRRTMITQGMRLECRWIDLDEIDAPKDDLRARGFAAGAARFSRGEGMWWGHDSAYFAATEGGHAKKGQLWRYIPSAHEGSPAEDGSPAMLELFIEPNDGTILEHADNLTVAPWGDLIVCEDGYGEHEDPGNRLLIITPRGDVSTFARNVKSRSEFAGACFSPDGSTLFVNLQGDGLTLAITGPWRS